MPVSKKTKSVKTSKKTTKAAEKEVDKATTKKNTSSEVKKHEIISQNKVTKGRSRVKKLLDNLVGERKEIGKYSAVVKKIEEFDNQMKDLTDEELKSKTAEFREKLKGLKDKEMEKKLTEILPEAFAVVREGAWRAIGQKHFPVQLIGGMVLNDGRVAEMRTGEGKTLVATLSIYLNSLPEYNQVHLVTVNDYLARRDASWMGKVYNFLGLSIGVIQNQASFYFKLGAQSDSKADKKRDEGRVETYEDGVLDDSRAVLDVENLVHCDRKRAYWDDELNAPVDIVYGVNSEFGFDYLRDNMANTPDEVVQKAGHCVAVIDEVDSILIDEARTPLIISSQDSDSSSRYRQFASLVKQLNPDLDYTVDEKRRICTLTELGIEKVERALNIVSLYESSENVVLIHHLDQALKARTLFRREKEYVVRDGDIVIVDEYTGRLMFGRRYNQGLHQALEAKENLNVKPESKTVATVTFQNYFRLYKKLSGMTGTAATEAEELFKIYKLVVVTIPTNKPMVRKDFVDKIYKSEAGKFKAIARDIKAIHQTGQPVLIGTTSIEKNLELSRLLTEAGVKHQVLNAKNHEQEAKIVSEAGKKSMVTLATNIAGRGVDIKLGGEVPEKESDLSKWKEDHEEIKLLGGLFVVGTERHESRRIDNQLRGRSGRQGDPGMSQFYISLEDYVLRVFGGDRITYYKNILPIAEDEAIQNKLLSGLIEEAQKKIEGQNFDVRKHVTEYDDVINRQRNVIYTRRKKVLLNDGFDWQQETEKAVYRAVLSCLEQIEKPRGKKSKIDIDQLKKTSSQLKSILSIADFDTNVLSVLLKDHKYKYAKVARILSEKLNYQLKTKWEIYENRVQSALSRFVFLRSIDVLWTEHLVTIDHLQDSVRLRGYSQKDPLVEFKQDGMTIFIGLLQEINKEIADTVFKVNPELVPAGILQS
ncbi:MAG: preprotein translocase subunit SecA [Patescibacteria group bacterium]